MGYNDLKNCLDTANKERKNKKWQKVLSNGLIPEQVTQGTGLPLEEVISLKQNI